MSEYPTTEPQDEIMTTQTEDSAITEPEDEIMTMSAEDSAIAEQEPEDTFLDDAAEFLSEQFEAAFAMLIERRDEAYVKAVATLDDERMALLRECGEIEEAIGNLEPILAAKATRNSRKPSSQRRKRQGTLRPLCVTGSAKSRFVTRLLRTKRKLSRAVLLRSGGPSARKSPGRQSTDISSPCWMA
jgi:hypothetical protein